MRTTLLTAVFTLGLAAHPGTAAEIRKGHYQSIEVTRFEVAPGVEFPESYLVTMTGELAAQLTEKKKFRHVLRQGETAGDGSSGPTLRVTGTVTEFQKGNRAVRYVVGFGAGKTKLKAHVKFIDAATGDVVWEKDVDGKVIIGLFGGESVGATRGLAKEVAKVTKQQFF